MHYHVSTEDGGTRRLTAKQAEAAERRSRMTQRRHEMSNRIRKEKKSKYLARKRNLSYVSRSSQPETGVMTQINTLNTLIQAFIQMPSITSLKPLELGLRSCDISQILKSSIDNPLVIRDEPTLAVSVMTNLQHVLQPPSISSTPTEADRLVALQTLVHLTAIPTDTSAITEGNYYGRSAESWCSCLVQVSGLLSCIVQCAHNLEPACVILGNLAGDHSLEVRRSLKDTGVVETLVTVIRQGNPTSHSGAAAWALTNIIRNDDTSWAKRYCSDTMLSPDLLETMLLLPQQCSQPSDAALLSTISTQTAWMIASLTSREQEIVNYLCSYPSFCRSLLRALEVLAFEKLSPISGHDDPSLPLIQALGHIASYAAYVPVLISLNLASIVRHLLQQSTCRGPVFSQTAWLAGCLLCDAGVADHPSTTVAAPILVPLLVDLLSQDRASALTLDEKREVVCALWNALAPPPPDFPDYGGNNTIPAQVMQHVPLPNTRALCMMLPMLVDLLGATDADAVVASVNVLSFLLRRGDDSLQTAFEEYNGKDAIENLCDSSQNETATEVAANLLDDLFENDDDDDGNDAMNLGGGINSSQPFTFGEGFLRKTSDGNGMEPEPSSRGGMGRGRGRGATLPAWMTQK